ncbi:ubiquitin carboxyl-terminal hydrolase 16 isoform X2 [Antennarius striatus]|uniref:ubiquitin carboxyl-terminal hydrolase 16 isoform X2 n=1 Tax=Antennarius striatus TaxID=241820 RepID=UPI0035B47D83
MGKKRGKERSSREEEDIDLTGPSCRHIKKGTDQNLLKKLSGNSDWTCCQDCKHEGSKENNIQILQQDSEDDQEPDVLWMCLKCGHRGCGRNSENQHAIKHFETPHSDPHCLVISLDSWSVWCYICDDEVQYSRTGHLAQLVTNLQKQTSSCPIKRVQENITEEDGLLEGDQKTPLVKPEEGEDKENKGQRKNSKKESVGKTRKCDTSESSGGISVKGLSNLGNTCFFNAVIQNLCQTQLLKQIINQVTKEKMSVEIRPVACSNLDPIGVQLEHPGSLTLAMCQLLNEMQETKKSVVTPKELFTQVCKKAARFKGFQQQDSQELLRYLLDGMRAEEIKRISSGILEALKESRKSIDEEQLKSLVKEYKKNGFPKNFVDYVFGGEMTSTIMCQQCKTVSVVTEMFLDLSLPVFDEAYRKKNNKKVVQNISDLSQDGRNSPASTSGNVDITPSKYQQKKTKKQAKKQAKQQKRQQKLEGRVILDSLSSPSQTESQQMHPIADETENADHEIPEDSPTEGNTADNCKPEQNQKKPNTLQDTKETEENEDSMTDCDSLPTLSVNNHFSVLEEHGSKDSIIYCDKTSDVDQEEDDMQLVSEINKVSLNDAFIEESEDVEQVTQSEDKALEANEYTIVNEDPELAFQTLAARKAPEKQECSVYSCLFHFTAVETLMQNNSLLCITCTKQQPNKDKAGGPKKGVYTDALKQMLISSPPPVLTLHLKRFQQNGYSICKVNRHVQFPMILDLASFCEVKCKNVTKGEILYSLYGIVEHSGTMRSGHYTAYVKVRLDCPKSTSIKLSSNGDAEPPKGSWFHISDTSVQPVNESKVQSCQAYLLFYERTV